MLFEENNVDGVKFVSFEKNHEGWFMLYGVFERGRLERLWWSVKTRLLLISEDGEKKVVVVVLKWWR